MAKESDSESEATRPCDGARFRIKVCMKHFFNDERANAYVCVRDCHRVRWLHRRLRALFALPPPFVLLSRGYLLPPDEPLAVLERDDIVDVIPARSDFDATDHSNSAGIDNVTCTVVSDPKSGVDNSDTTDSISMKPIARTVNLSVYHTPLEPDTSKSSAEPDTLNSGMEQDTINTREEPENVNLGTADLELEDDVTNTNVSVYEDDELRDRKRRALAMLQEICGEPEDIPRKSKRRRVRRRRRVASSLDNPDDSSSITENATLIGKDATPIDQTVAPMTKDANIMDENSTLVSEKVTPVVENAVLRSDKATPTEDNISTQSPSPESRKERVRDASILRNGCQRPRAPRIIRPLGEDIV